ncbi:MAG: peptidoglycan-binding protein [Gammaproteobacteria bacterium HGW-Gammaproteobacteria-1]|jgi:hypothetical protein|nr:MAG: peptidoglycan-binding protein [Gammaproteobacteria bacterium HGW-Gammaproteobacteria-1]
MPKGIARSVGNGGANEHRDVKIVQIYLNSFIALDPSRKPIAEDGLIGMDTISAIREFQRKSVGMPNPDGRVDPNGKTYRYLTMYFDAAEQDKIEQSLRQTNAGGAKSPLTAGRIYSKAGLSSLAVAYSGVNEGSKIVSDYSINVIKLALKEAGMNKAVITSTIRTAEEQAQIMLKNAKKDLAAQYRLYGSKGDSVLKLYADNKAKSDAEVVKLMVAKIDEITKGGSRVSQHCVSVDTYKKINIIDLGFNATKAVCKNFDAVKFTNALKSLESEGYIDKLIDETKKSNSCWHLEIKPNKKSIPDYDKGSILLPVKYINGRTRIC